MLLGSPRGVVANVLDCDIVVKDFEPSQCYYVHFRKKFLGKGIKPIIRPTAMD